MDILARNLAFALNDEAALSALSAQTRRADNKERIIDLSKWLNKNIAGQTLADRMALSGNVENIDGRQRQATANDFIMLTQSLKPMVDIYFPVDEHRAGWYQRRNDLLIAVVHPAKEWEPATAYKLNGEKVELSPYTIPEEPVLVVSLCEHRGIHPGNRVKINAPIDNDGGGSGGGGSYGPRVNGNAEILKGMTLHDDCEPWILGDAEIYTICASPSGGELSVDYLVNVDDDGPYYQLNHELFNWYWNDYGNWYKLKIAEEDGWGVDFEINIFGTTVEIDIYNDDDDLGAKVVNKNDAYNKKYSTGKADFWITYEE